MKKERELITWLLLLFFAERKTKMANRAERRRLERDAKKTDGYSPQMDMAVRKAINERIERKQIRDEAALMASGPLLKSVYAAIVSVLSDDYGFESELCQDILEKVDEKTALCLDSDEMAEEAFRKAGVRIRLGEAFDRIERTK